MYNNINNSNLWMGLQRRQPNWLSTEGITWFRRCIPLVVLFFWWISLAVLFSGERRNITTLLTWVGVEEEININTKYYIYSVKHTFMICDLKRLARELIHVLLICFIDWEKVYSSHVLATKISLKRVSIL